MLDGRRVTNDAMRVVKSVGLGTPSRRRQKIDETIGRARRSESIVLISVIFNIPTTALVASYIETSSEPGLERGEEFFESVGVERYRE